MKKENAFLIVVFCFISTIGFAQKQRQIKIDSLFNELKKYKSTCKEPCLKDSSKVNLLNLFSWQLGKKNTDSAMQIANEALQLSNNIEWSIGAGQALHNIGTFYMYKGEYELSLKNLLKSLSVWNDLEKNADKNSANILNKKSRTLGNIGMVLKNQGNYNKALDIFSEILKNYQNINDSDGIAKTLANMGHIYHEQGNYIRALENYLSSLKIANKLGDKSVEADNLANIGMVYKEQGDYVKALDYYFKALKIDQQMNNSDKVSIHYGNIGNVFRHNADFESAIKFINKAISLAEEKGNKDYLAAFYSNMGNVYADKGDSTRNRGHINLATKEYDTAMEFYNKARKIQEETQDYEGVAINLSNTGLLYSSIKNYSQAEKTLLKALHLADSIGHLYTVLETNQFLSLLYSEMGNYKKALEHYKRSIEAKDSLFNEEKTKEITQKEMQYTFDKQQDSVKVIQDKKDTQAKAELEKQKLLRNSIAGGAGIISLSALLSFVFYKRKRDAEQLQKETTLSLQVSETEMKALRSQMNPHFIFNALQSIQTFLMSHQSEEANTYLLKFSKLMRAVLENSQHREISLQKDMQALELYMQLESIRLPHPFTYAFHIDETIDVEEVTIPPLILQPFVENAIWHGLQYKTEPGHINIYLSKKDNALNAIVEDNGVGRDMSKKVAQPMLLKKESLGMKLTEERLKILNELKKIKAQFKITDLFTKENIPSGTRVELSLPIVA